MKTFFADMAELADASVLGADGLNACAGSNPVVRIIDTVRQNVAYAAAPGARSAYRADLPQAILFTLSVWRQITKGVGNSMGALVFIIIILVFIVRAVSLKNLQNDGTNKGQKAGMPDPANSVPPQPDRPKPQAKTARPNQPKTRVKTAKPNQPKPRTKTAQSNRPQPDRPKPRERTFRPSDSAQDMQAVFRGADADDILASARENNFEVQMENDKDMMAGGDLMERVYDLMVQGPEDTLSFQRDFVSEGMDMLNRML